MSQRWSAVLALGCFGAGVALLGYGTLESFPTGLVVALLVLAALAVGWQGLIRRGRPRVVSWIVAALCSWGLSSACWRTGSC